MPNLSETDLQTIINFFTQKRTLDESEQILRKFAAEHTEAFLSTIKTITKPVRVSIVIPSHVMLQVANSWMNWKPDGFGTLPYCSTQEAWARARAMYENYNPTIKNIDEEEAKAIVATDVYKAYYQSNQKIQAIKFRRAVSGSGLKEAKEWLDKWWDDYKEQLRNPLPVQNAPNVTVDPAALDEVPAAPIVEPVRRVAVARNLIYLPPEAIKEVTALWIRDRELEALELFRREKNLTEGTPVYNDALKEVTCHILNIHTGERRRNAAMSFLLHHTQFPKEKMEGYIATVARENGIELTDNDFDGLTI